MNLRKYNPTTHTWVQTDDNFGRLGGILVSVLHEVNGRWLLQAAFYTHPRP